ncbi:MAG: PLP-dependent aminotransferase family protein [Burkholderiaceae bacterium]
MSKIIEITLELRQHIEQCYYSPNQKFFSVRELAEKYQISPNSANKILQSLEDLDLVQSYPKRGFFIKNKLSFKNLILHKKSTVMPIFCANEHIKNRSNSIRIWAEMVNSRGRVRMDLATGSPEFYPTLKLQTTHNRLARHNPSIFTEYAFGVGSVQLRNQVSTQYVKSSCLIHPDEILITQGATQALIIALQATTQAGDWVLIEAPTYFGFLQILDTLQLNAVELPINTILGLQPENLRSAIAHAKKSGRIIRACLLQANYHNPTGLSIPQEVRAKLLDICNEHNIAIIEDDTFGELHHNNNERGHFSPLKSLDKKGNVILCSSLSKLIAPGLRVGFVSGGQWHEKIKTLQHSTAISCSTMPQLVLAEFMKQSYSLYLKKLRNICRENVLLAAKIIQLHFPKNTQVIMPKGGYLLWLTLPEKLNTDLLLLISLEKYGIAFAPGILFSNISNHRQSMRINCALMSQIKEQEGLKKLGELAKRECDLICY